MHPLLIIFGVVGGLVGVIGTCMAIYQAGYNAGQKHIEPAKKRRTECVIADMRNALNNIEQEWKEVDH
jgi:hypothetical protein